MTFSKYTGNPVFGNVEMGTAFDAYTIYDGEKYRMDFSRRAKKSCAVTFSKDYNHSTFIDPVLRGLVGVDIYSDEFRVIPDIKGIWDYFSVENLTFRGRTYNIYYDEDETHFGMGKGVTVREISITPNCGFLLLYILNYAKIPSVVTYRNYYYVDYCGLLTFR